MTLPSLAPRFISRRLPLSCVSRKYPIRPGRRRWRSGAATSAISPLSPVSRVTQYSARSLSSSANPDDNGDIDNPLAAPREAMETDVLIVGAGPAGLAAAIRLKQLDKSGELSVLVVDKSSEIGGHVLSGNVFEPRSMDELLPERWRTEFDGKTDVTSDSFLMLLDEERSFRLPDMALPSALHNDGNFVISLGKLVRYLGDVAEELGVEVYPGFAASEVLYDEDGGGVRGVATRDVGIGKDGQPKATFERGMELRARQTIFAEGARGSCAEECVERFGLRDGRDVQTYGLGVKEVWEVPESVADPGCVLHSVGWPLQRTLFDKTFGGSFLYHMSSNLVHVGMVVGLDYENPYINPYREFQRWKTHPSISKHLEGGTCVSYGARVLNEGGLHSIPKLSFPGGLIVGCSAGFLNSVKIKGTHTAIKSGMIAAETMHETLTGKEQFSVAITGEISPDEPVMELSDFEDKMKSSWVYDELREVRNCHASFHMGFLPGMMYTGLATHILKGKEPWTFRHTVLDSEMTKEASNYSPIDYPQPDGVLTFDLLTNLQRSGVYHEDDQPAHLQIKPEFSHVPKGVSMQKYAGPEQRFCPAGVYEYVPSEEKDSDDGQKDLVINAQNCVHCKCCSIKMPQQYIQWTVPEGGGGPQYQVM